jgi:hypothetical protein
MDKEESFCNSTCEDQINMVELELSAFIRAVTELFGPEQARLSTKDWLDQSEPMDSPHTATRKRVASGHNGSLCSIGKSGDSSPGSSGACSID